MTAPRNINRCTPCLEQDHRRCTGSAGNVGCGCIHAAPVPRPVTDRDELVQHLQQHRREMLRAIRACPSTAEADYWRWQGHAELSRQLLERMGAEVPQ